jgi:hypothetical protein
MLSFTLKVSLINCQDQLGLVLLNDILRRKSQPSNSYEQHECAGNLSALNTHRSQLTYVSPQPWYSQSLKPGRGSEGSSSSVHLAHTWPATKGALPMQPQLLIKYKQDRHSTHTWHALQVQLPYGCC